MDVGSWISNFTFPLDRENQGVNGICREKKRGPGRERKGISKPFATVSPPPKKKKLNPEAQCWCERKFDVMLAASASVTYARQNTFLSPSFFSLAFHFTPMRTRMQMLLDCRQLDAAEVPGWMGRKMTFSHQKDGFYLAWKTYGLVKIRLRASVEDRHLPRRGG